VVGPSFISLTIFFAQRPQDGLEVAVAEATEYAIRDAKLLEILAEGKVGRWEQEVVLNFGVGLVHSDNEGKIRTAIFDLSDFPASRSAACYRAIGNGPGDCNDHGNCAV
jgi:hypothetical protein